MTLMSTVFIKNTIIKIMWISIGIGRILLKIYTALIENRAYRKNGWIFIFIVTTMPTIFFKI